MSTWSTRGIAAGIAALALVVGSAAATQADAFRHRDATGDVRVFPDAPFFPVDPSASHVDSRKSDPDIQQFTVLHGRWALNVATSFRALASSGNLWRAFIVTSKGDRFVLERRTDEMTNKPYYNLYRNNDSLAYACDGVRASRTSSGMIGKVPTRCLGNPWKVRVGVNALTGYRAGEGSGMDDAMLDGTVTQNVPVMTPWIAR